MNITLIESIERAISEGRLSEEQADVILKEQEERSELLKRLKEEGGAKGKDKGVIKALKAQIDYLPNLSQAIFKVNSVNTFGNEYLKEWEVYSISIEALGEQLDELNKGRPANGASTDKCICGKRISNVSVWHNEKLNIYLDVGTCCTARLDKKAEEALVVFKEFDKIRKDPVMNQLSDKALGIIGNRLGSSQKMAEKYRKCRYVITFYKKKYGKNILAGMFTKEYQWLAKQHKTIIEKLDKTRG